MYFLTTTIVEEPSKIQDIISMLIDKGIDFGLRLISAFAIFIIGKMIIGKLVNIIKRILEKSQIDVSVVKFLNSLIKVVLYIILVVIICGQVGIETTSFAAILASGGLAIGLAFEGSLSNLAGGVLILVMKPFKVGDYIEVSGDEGTVEKIEIFYTSLRTGDNKAVKLPNGVLSNSVITNYSMHNTRRVDVTVGIEYGDDCIKAKRVLTDLMNSYENILSDNDNQVVVKEYADSCIQLQIRMWVATENYWDGYFYLNEHMNDKLTAAGITIPYNKLDVRLTQ